jgi:hypothetical protein
MIVKPRYEQALAHWVLLLHGKEKFRQENENVAARIKPRKIIT